MKLKSAEEWVKEFTQRQPYAHFDRTDLACFIIEIQRDTVKHCGRMAQSVVRQTLGNYGQITFELWNEIPRKIKKGSKSEANLHLIAADPTQFLYYPDGEVTNLVGFKVVDKEDFA